MFEAATKTLFKRKEIVHTNKPLNLEGMIIFFLFREDRGSDRKHDLQREIRKAERIAKKSSPDR